MPRRKETEFVTIDVQKLRKGAKILIVPHSFPVHVDVFREYLEKHSIDLWRSWWEHLLKVDECCCCCCCAAERAPVQPVASQLVVNLHLNFVEYVIVGGSMGCVIHVGWMVTGATGQVEVTLEVSHAGGPYRRVTTLQGRSVPEYQYPEHPSAALGNFAWPHSSYSFRATASDQSGSSVTELPVRT